MVRDVKGDKEGFYMYTGRKRNMRENACLLPNGAAALLTKNTERPRFSMFYLSQSFLVILAFRNESQTSKTIGKVRSKENLPSDTFCNFFSLFTSGNIYSVIPI